MCLNCQYGNYGKCDKCRTSTCYRELRSNGYICCDDCFRTMQKKRRCRTCHVIFNSGNDLFKHLSQFNIHNKNYERICEKTFNTWMEEYVHLGFMG